MVFSLLSILKSRFHYCLHYWCTKFQRPRTCKSIYFLYYEKNQMEKDNEHELNHIKSPRSTNESGKPHKRNNTGTFSKKSCGKRKLLLAFLSKWGDHQHPPPYPLVSSQKFPAHLFSHSISFHTICKICQSRNTFPLERYINQRLSEFLKICLRIF